MIGLAGAGQSDTAWKPSLTDSIYLSGGGGGLAIDTLTKNGTTRFSAVGSWYGGSGTVIQTNEPKYDTVAILYLYADTVRRAMEDGKFVGGYARWDFGYEVRSGFYGIIGYLDRHKNPVRKSIVLFMTKTIEK